MIKQFFGKVRSEYFVLMCEMRPISCWYKPSANSFNGFQGSSLSIANWATNEKVLTVESLVKIDRTEEL